MCFYQTTTTYIHQCANRMLEDEHEKQTLDIPMETDEPITEIPMTCEDDNTTLCLMELDNLTISSDTMEEDDEPVIVHDRMDEDAPSTDDGNSDIELVSHDGDFGGLGGNWEDTNELMAD